MREPVSNKREARIARDLMAKDKAKPFLRWAGSKKKLLPKLTSYWNDNFSRYVEPFMGSASLFFSIAPSKAVLSDINSELVHTYCVVRDHPKRIHTVLTSLPKGKEAYYRIRSQNPKDLPAIERAAKFVYLNRFCFNGIYRTNTKGEFNVPYSPKGTGDLPTLEELREISNVLQSVNIRCADFETILLKKVRKNDFVYLDPPFAVANRRVFRQYGPQTFGLSDLKRLNDALVHIDRVGAKFLVSYAVCKEALKCFSEWNIKRAFTQRNVSGFAEHRRRAVELLVSNI
jgi:DNA adenine methylase